MLHEKDKVVYYVWMFIEHKDLTYANEAKEWLKKLAKRYNLTVKISKTIKKSLKVAFEEFLLNNIGYRGAKGTINVLYNSI